METKKYYVEELNKKLNEIELKELLLYEKIESIKDQSRDYINGEIDIKEDCDIIRNIKELQISSVINELKEKHEYTIKIVEE